MIAFPAAFVRLVGPFHEALISLIARRQLQQKMQPALRQLLIITAVRVRVNTKTISCGFVGLLRAYAAFLSPAQALVNRSKANEQARGPTPLIPVFAGGQAVHERGIAVLAKKRANPCTAWAKRLFHPREKRLFTPVDKVVYSTAARHEALFCKGTEAIFTSHVPFFTCVMNRRMQDDRRALSRDAKRRIIGDCAHARKDYPQ